MPPRVLRNRPTVYTPGSLAPEVLKGGLGAIVRNSVFTYVQNVTFTANETQTFTIQIQSDAHFLLVETSLAAQTAAGAALTIPDGGSMVQLRDVSANRLLSSAPVAASNLFGTAQRPFILPFTHVFRAGGGITMDTTGTTGAAQVARYAFHGFKVPIGNVPWLDQQFAEMRL